MLKLIKLLPILLCSNFILCLRLHYFSVKQHKTNKQNTKKPNLNITTKIIIYGF